MTRFKEALLDELVAHAQTAAAPTARPARRVVRWVAVPVAGLAAAALAFVIVPGGGASPAYAVESNPDGTVTVTFAELGHADDATRDLRAAGVRAQVVRLSAPGSCATGGTPFVQQPGSAAEQGMPPSFPFDDIRSVLPAQTATGMTIRPDQIPAGAVLFIVEHSGPTSGVMLGAALVHGPAPTCWEVKKVVAFQN